MEKALFVGLAAACLVLAALAVKQSNDLERVHAGLAQCRGDLARERELPPPRAPTPDPIPAPIPVLPSSPTLPPAPARAAATIDAFTWQGLGADVVGREETTPNGASDGHFTLRLRPHKPGMRVIALRVFSSDEAGAPTAGQFWDTTDPDHWTVGALDRGRNLVRGKSLAPFELPSNGIELDLACEDSGFFRDGSWFSVDVTFEDGSKVSATSRLPRAAAWPPWTVDASGEEKQTLSKVDVLHVIKAGVPAIERCGKEHGVTATLKTTWRVLPTGKTSAVEVLDVTHKGSPVARCVERAIGSWRFPAHTEQLPPITFPFKLP